MPLMYTNLFYIVLCYVLYIVQFEINYLPTYDHYWAQIGGMLISAGLPKFPNSMKVGNCL